MHTYTGVPASPGIVAGPVEQIDHGTTGLHRIVCDPFRERALYDVAVVLAKDDYRPFVWQRGDLICAVNPAGVSIELPLELAEDLKIQYTIGQAEIVNDTLSLGAQSFVILG